MWFKSKPKIFNIGPFFASPQPLKIWLVSDVHSPDQFTMAKLNPKEFDLALTLGDVSAEVLDYVKWMAADVPAFGIYGNHDPQYIPGLQSIDGAILKIKGWTISGISGCGLNYGRGQKKAVHVYSEGQIERKLRSIGSVDILISHAPPLCVSLEEDVVHQGFKALDKYIQLNQPKYVIHGHLHKRYRQLVGGTTIVGIYEKDYLKLEIG